MMLVYLIIYFLLLLSFSVLALIRVHLRWRNLQASRPQKSPTGSPTTVAVTAPKTTQIEERTWEEKSAMPSSATNYRKDDAMTTTTTTNIAHQQQTLSDLMEEDQTVRDTRV